MSRITYAPPGAPSPLRWLLIIFAIAIVATLITDLLLEAAMHFLVGYTLFVGIVWMLAWLGLKEMPWHGSAVYVPCIILTGIDLIAWLAFVMNKALS